MNALSSTPSSFPKQRIYAFSASTLLLQIKSVQAVCMLMGLIPQVTAPPDAGDCRGAEGPCPCCDRPCPGFLHRHAVAFQLPILKANQETRQLLVLAETQIKSSGFRMPISWGFYWTSEIFCFRNPRILPSGQ